MTNLILNVDDVAAHRYVKSRLLRQAGYDIVEAQNGAEALRLAYEINPDLVLLDVNLPDMSGLEVCRAIKASNIGARTPVVHITATFIDDDGELTSLQHGADVYLAEPVEPQTLLTIVGVLLRLRKTEAGLSESVERMRLATQAAGIATWDIDLDTGNAVWSEELYHMLGYTPGSVQPSWEAWQARIHPADRARVLDAMRRAQQNMELFRAEHRILRAIDASERYVAPFGKVYPDDRGQRKRFLGVLVDLTDRRKAELEREQLLFAANVARAEAEQASRLKDNFLASLSHELRTPMHAILGWMQLLRGGALSAKERADALDTIERNARLQNQLINELLDVSRATAGKLDIEVHEVDVERVLQAALESVRPVAEAKEIELIHALDKCLGTIRGDASRLQQILGNLLSNAVKFTPRGGHVRIDCRSRGPYIEISVVDDGEGIAAEHLPHVFEAFRQADGSITRRHGGLGLGLSIAHRLVHLHGGKIEAHSEGLGRGARFTVRLPLSESMLTPYAPDSDVPSVQDSEARLKGISVLAVDDNEDMLQLMEQMLSWEGAIVRIAANGRDAMRIAAEFVPDVLVLDIGMPDENGYDLLKRLRNAASKSAAHLPAIAVTGYASAEDTSRSLAAGFQAHLAKPFEMNQLFASIESVVTKPRG